MDVLQVVPATAERWADLEELFGKSGAAGGCWCMLWRMDRASYKLLKGEGTKSALRSLTLDGKVPGLLAYLESEVVGWCGMGPRENFIALENSRILKRVDDQPVWSIVCFYVSKQHRQQGVTLALLKGAVDYAASQGAKIVEGYPIDLDTPQLQGQTFNSYSGYMGIASVYRAVGFVEAGQASATQRIMRFFVK